METIKPNVVFANNEKFYVSYMAKNPTNIVFAIYISNQEDFERLISTIKDPENFRKIVYETPFATDTIEERLKFDNLQVLPEYYYLSLKR